MRSFCEEDSSSSAMVSRNYKIFKNVRSADATETAPNPTTYYHGHHLTYHHHNVRWAVALALLFAGG